MLVLIWVVGSLMMWNAFITQWMKIYEMPLMENSIFSRQWDLFYHERCDRRTNYPERWWISFPRMCLCGGYIAICWGCFNLLWAASWIQWLKWPPSNSMVPQMQLNIFKYINIAYLNKKHLAYLNKKYLKCIITV